MKMKLKYLENQQSLMMKLFDSIVKKEKDVRTNYHHKHNPSSSRTLT